MGGVEFFYRVVFAEFGSRFIESANVFGNFDFCLVCVEFVFVVECVEFFVVVFCESIGDGFVFGFNCGGEVYDYVDLRVKRIRRFGRG